MSHPDAVAPAVRRSLVTCDALFAVSDAGVATSRLATLGYVAFPPEP